MALLIRPLTPGDEPLLWQTLYHALHVPPGSEPFPPAIVHHPELARYVAGWMQRPGDMGFAAEVDGTPIGAAWLRCWLADNHGYGFLDVETPELSMALSPEHRGGGIGTALLRRLLSEATHHFSAVGLSVSASNPARRLYEREGFQPIAKPEDDSVIMLTRLEAVDNSS